LKTNEDSKTTAGKNSMETLEAWIEQC